MNSFWRCFQDAEYVYGEIVRSVAEDLHLSDETASLLLDDEAGTVIKLDLSRLPEISIFPGQVGKSAIWNAQDSPIYNLAIHLEQDCNF